MKVWKKIAEDIAENIAIPTTITATGRGSKSAERALRYLYPGNTSAVDFRMDHTLPAAFADLVSPSDSKARLFISHVPRNVMNRGVLHAMLFD